MRPTQRFLFPEDVGKRSFLECDDDAAVHAENPPAGDGKKRFVKIAAKNHDEHRAIYENLGVHYFWPAMCHSFTDAQFAEMMNQAIDEKRFRECETCDPEQCPEHTANRLCHSLVVGPPVFSVTMFQEGRFERKSNNRPPNVFVDHSNTERQTVCWLTKKPYDRPHILNSNGRSYSIDALLSAIRKISRDSPLFLEGDSRIMYEDIPMLCLWPNYSLPGWTALRYSIDFHPVDETSRREFDFKRCEAATLASEWFDTNKSFKFIWAKYLEERHMVSYRTHLPRPKGMVFSDLVISNIVFPRVHPDKEASFVNVLFSECVINMICFCNVKFIACKFDKCVFVLGKHYRATDYANSIMADCSFFVQTDDHELGNGIIANDMIAIASTIKCIVPLDTVTPRAMEYDSRDAIVKLLIDVVLVRK